MHPPPSTVPEDLRSVPMSNVANAPQPPGRRAFLRAERKDGISDCVRAE